MADSKLRRNIIIGVSGSVAAIKLPELVVKTNKRFSDAAVKVISTKNALNFFKTHEVSAEVLTDENEWTKWEKIGDPILHIDLCKWADLMVIAPLDANTLAKIANGMCDNLLTCVVRAWRGEKPLIFAPAMNSFMYDHPLTLQQISTLQSFGYKLIPPVEKKLACGDYGIGAMASTDDIANAIETILI
eukprot:Seg747.8 transcript_id=Seg747.8/GoldUCD/mRNA.D3Y31 product="Phosphopantothenoylcysteine decarboxylase" protein_id=Seg747.8/GoldUCD/D3Y31